MPELLKNVYSKAFVSNLAEIVGTHQNNFAASQFIGLVFQADWNDLELKARMTRISLSLGETIQGDYKAQLKIILATADSLRGLDQRGFEFMFLPDFVEQFGMQELKRSTTALVSMTDLASAEFAVRPFLIRYGESMMDLMLAWTSHESEHVRRLASEGCRPRLPWAMALPNYKLDPRPVVKLLKRLKNDSSLYVRRSVANNLNDISKDNPQVLVDLVQQWYGTNSDTDWIVKHACRGLLKQAQPDIMNLFGYGDVEHIQIKQFVADRKVTFGEKLNFSFALVSTSGQLGKLRIEFAIDHMKANGNLKRKIFKISASDDNAKSKAVARGHQMKPISTRKYYNGKHRLAILVNGVELHCQAFVLSGV
jgi:3-methyladenine DNA glycosylase AlkC